MSSDAAYDPYRTPVLPEGPPGGGSTSGRPGWLTAVCVMCIVLGVLGAMNGVAGVFGTLFGQQMQQAFTPRGAGGLPPEMQKVQDDFQDEMAAVQEKFFWGLLASTLLRIAVAAGLIYGGIVCLGIKPGGRQALLVACGAALLFEIGIIVLQSLINMEMMTAINGYLENFLQSMPAEEGNGPPKEMLLTIMKGSIIAGFVLQYVLIAVKMLFYLLCMYYLQRQAIKALFDQAPAGKAALA
jgi:hypothetical protein